jgi:thiamine-phosphate pyrophosphorylase
MKEIAMDIQSTASHIARIHSQLLAGDPAPIEMSLLEIPVDSSPVFEAAWLGARLLGFVPHDAQCIAAAWQSQTKREGKFETANWPCEPQDFSLTVHDASIAFAPCPASLGLYAVLPDANWVARMVELEVPTVQLRFKSDDKTAIEREVKKAVSAVKNSNTLLFINDHWQDAINSGAYGVHLGQEDMVDAPLDAIKSAGLRLGLSSHGYAEMIKAHAAQPSYLALGAVFPTTLKRMATAPQGVGRLSMYARLMRAYSLVAIGGIDLSSLSTVLQSGVGSVAFVRAITAADNVAQTVAKLTQYMQALRTREA